MRYLTIFFTIILSGIVVLAASALCGCTRTVYATSDCYHAHTDTVSVSVTRVDSVYRLDSIYLAGDTVVRERVSYRYRLLRDTLWRTRTDTVCLVRESTPPAAATPAVSGFLDTIAMHTGRAFWVCLAMTVLLVVLRRRFATKAEKQAVS